jgi:hypothetical protein
MVCLKMDFIYCRRFDFIHLRIGRPHNYCLDDKTYTNYCSDLNFINHLSFFQMSSGESEGLYDNFITIFNYFKIHMIEFEKPGRFRGSMRRENTL